MEAIKYVLGALIATSLFGIGVSLGNISGNIKSLAADEGRVVAITYGGVALLPAGHVMHGGKLCARWATAEVIVYVDCKDPDDLQELKKP